ncbi:MAG: SDR family NAD(P)-dependent oxidoreductase [Rhodospirillaceae bacterium]|nr:SDR family NAD(P)-dependent oxidoreductase [Rhodospirillales bacterium]MBT3906825.1 SDR family NAD(P)-dependent oxidoreductase [Rhodospirillaceae bacterium]MBT4701802.1 SDR family NAD(P)-dependent oxidoreductase [Rhodospirillaceae bacterium]MBT5035811.1 SDR family NAD(P)-dependent oxidoreductase [Rhodospirillaceae bacterium]MBT6221966.1 SDR family NAD(P)-dependent oxidoreductase [Rhodospirillaceae bacterium]
MPEDGKLAGKIALITGASRGIGAAVAKRFAAEGAHVILVARTQAGLEEVDDEIRDAGGTATLFVADLTDYDKIDQMGAALFERFGRLDVLVGNAGILGDLSPIGHIDPQAWDQVMAVNTTANWRLLRSCDPLLRQSDAGRAIFVSSSVGATPKAYWSIYAISKAALEMMVKIYALEIENTAIRANLINPGATRTNMRALAMPGEDPETLKTPDDVTDYFIDLALPGCTCNGETINAKR